MVLEHDWDLVRRIMWDYVGIVRDRERLDIALARLRDHPARRWRTSTRPRSSDPELVELRNIALLGELIVLCARARRESRGLHYTLDHPGQVARGGGHGHGAPAIRAWKARLPGARRRPWLSPGTRRPSAPTTRLLYAHRDEAEAARCLALLPGLRRCLARARSWTWAAATAGTWRLLPAAGRRAVGLDLSAELLAAARRERPDRACLWCGGTCGRCPWPTRCLRRGAVALHRLRLLRRRGRQRETRWPEAARVLRPGGHWCLDYFDADRVPG